MFLNSYLMVSISSSKVFSCINEGRDIMDEFWPPIMASLLAEGHGFPVIPKKKASLFTRSSSPRALREISSMAFGEIPKGGLRIDKYRMALSAEQYALTGRDLLCCLGRREQRDTSISEILT